MPGNFFASFGAGGGGFGDEVVGFGADEDADVVGGVLLSPLDEHELSATSTATVPAQQATVLAARTDLR